MAPCTPIEHTPNCRQDSDSIPSHAPFSGATESACAPYADKIALNPSLNRRLVSFQDCKNVPFYRWFKYKEAFAPALVRYLLGFLNYGDVSRLNLLDPFSGIGTTVTTAAEMGFHATGIEMLPVGVAAMRARLLGHRVSANAFEEQLSRCLSSCGEGLQSISFRFPHVNITRRAFPERTEAEIGQYMGFVDSIPEPDLRYLFRFACLSVLEDVSFTRKDGQYLRWDMRSNRGLKSRFRKGDIKDFRSAIREKLSIMLEDIKARRAEMPPDRIEIIQGSCLSEMPELPSESFDTIITSPPYANRYDYTRTYALELAFLNYDDEAIKKLRQAMLSCTVENKSKKDTLAAQYAKRGQTHFYRSMEAAFDTHAGVQQVLTFLESARKDRTLNNNNIPDLLRGYLFEMNLTIHEMARVLKPGGIVFMVNDNVRYHGLEIPIDLVLSDFARSAGLTVERIWVLPRGKGNSSQQMGTHGRSELRKCVYYWSKPGK
ncbi:MAG: site-specific DNA-methyltransferase [Thermodesulfobacteriota bacterium]